MTDTTIVHRIRSRVLAAEGHKFETTDYKSALSRLAEVQKRDPNARLVNVPLAGR
jgi:hypothetical protein